MLFPTIERDLTTGEPRCTLRLLHVNGRFQGLLFYDDPARYPEYNAQWRIKRSTQGTTIAEVLERFETNYIDCVAPMVPHTLDRELAELVECWLIAGYHVTIAQWGARAFSAFPHEPLFNPYDWRRHPLVSADRGATIGSAISNQFYSLKMQR